MLAPSTAARLERTRAGDREQREGSGEDGIARELVEEEHVAGVQKERSGGRDRSRSAEAPRDRAPREHGGGVQRRCPELGRERSQIEQPARHERGDRRPCQHRVRVDDVGVEELRVDEQVAGEIAPCGERERVGDEPVHHERGADEGRSGAGAVGEPLAGTPGPT